MGVIREMEVVIQKDELAITHLLKGEPSREGNDRCENERTHESGPTIECRRLVGLVRRVKPGGEAPSGFL